MTLLGEKTDKDQGGAANEGTCDFTDDRQQLHASMEKDAETKNFETRRKGWQTTSPYSTMFSLRIEAETKTVGLTQCRFSFWKTHRYNALPLLSEKQDEVESGASESCSVI